MFLVRRFLEYLAAAAHVDLAEDIEQIAVAPEGHYRSFGKGVGVLSVGVE